MTTNTTKPRRTIVRTTEQRERKRVQDREAQRLSRERNKALLDTLEQQVSDLQVTNQAYHDQISNLIREKDTAVADALEARRRANVAERKLLLLSRRLIAAVDFLGGSGAENHTQYTASGGPQSPAVWPFPNHQVPVVSAPAAAPPTPQWSLATKNTLTTCPLDKILSSFVESRRKSLQSGETETDVDVSPSPSLSTLLGFCPSAAVPDACQVITDIVIKVQSVHRLPEQVAVIWLMWMFLCWQINPTFENYQRLPEWIHPIPIQHTNIHPVWMSYVPWPKMREQIVQNHLSYAQDNFFLPYAQDLSVNWPHDDMGTVSIQDHDSKVYIDPKFEAHIRKLENWSLGRNFASAYPSLIGTFGMSES